MPHFAHQMPLKIIDCGIKKRHNHVREEKERKVKCEGVGRRKFLLSHGSRMDEFKLSRYGGIVS